MLSRSMRSPLPSRLQEQGIDTRPFFLGMHEQPVLRERGLFLGETYPVTERLARRGLYLPSGLGLGERADRCGLCRGTKVSGVTEVFGRNYADAYDAIYRSKDYPGEVALIERILVSHGLCGPAPPARSRLRHGQSCAAAGAARSRCRRRRPVAGDAGPSAPENGRARVDCVEFRSGDIRNLDLGRNVSTRCL